MATLSEDILSQLTRGTQTGSNNQYDDIRESLQNIEKDIHNACIDLARGSQSSARDRVRGGGYRGQFDERYQNYSSRVHDNQGDLGRGARTKYKDFTDELEDELIRGLLGSNISGGVSAVLKDFGKTLADTIGVELEDVPGALGKELGSRLADAFKNTSVGGAITSKMSEIREKSTNYLKDYLSKNFNQGVQQFTQSGKIFGAGWMQNAARSAATSSAAQAASAATVATSGAGAGATLAGLASTAGPVISSIGTGLTTVATALPAIIAAAAPLLPIIVGVAGVFALLKFSTGELNKSFKRLGKGWESFTTALSNAGDRYENSREQNLKFANERIKADIMAMIEQPFQILEDAAKSVQDAWDSSLHSINATQGYTKADLQDLMSQYAERLRSEGLSSVVSGSDITTNLTKVLDSGMSGRVAEEFAYMATKLQAAIPTQDFFNYADTYVQLAANRIKAGESEERAIAYANKQMELFASNVLYASRQLTGGFTTGLKNAGDLFSQAVKIAETSKIGDPSQIAGVLTSVSAITGAIAPDLASSIVDAVVKAATGGNSSDIVALRSLAGGNASNTEFLRMLSENPKKVFSTLFSNLGRMQTMSESNYMEVAEGLSQLFGISLDAFARIDFNYLASSIGQMQVNQNSLAENMKHLQSGETTLTAEQLRYQQINEYMLEEGLSYVLDNEVARVVQQNMWDEQRHRESLEATYGVELKGSSLELLEGIRSTIKSLFNFLNPFSVISKVANMAGTALEASAQEKELRKVLEMGKVGQGNAKALHDLTTRNEDLKLTKRYVQMLGGYSSYSLVSGLRNGIAGLGNNTFGTLGALVGGASKAQSAVLNVIGSALGYVTDSLMDRFSDSSNRRTSAYSWGSITKSTSNSLNAILQSKEMNTLAANAARTQSGTSAAKSNVASRLSQMLDAQYMNDKFISQGKSYEDFVASAKNFGITNFSSALKDAGYSEAQVQSMFEQQSAIYAQEQNAQRYQREEDFWTRQNLFADNEESYTLTLTDLLRNTNMHLVNIMSQQITFKKAWDTYYQQWEDYFIKHTAYNNSYNASKVDEIVKRENDEKGQAIYSLAEILTNNLNSLSDPQMQTNAILAQILIVLNAIMQHNNSAAGSLSLVETLAGLSQGGIIRSDTTTSL